MLEDAPPGSVLLTVRTTDADSGSNALVSFSLAPDPTSPRDINNLFAIGETTGELYTLANIDRETESTYRMYVIANDRPESDASLSAIAAVEIQVIDVNDHAPHIRVNVPTFPALPEMKDEARKKQESRRQGQGHGAEEVENVTLIVVSHESPIGTFISHVTVDDLDSDENGQFACQLVGESAVKFQLHRMYQTEFKIVTSSQLDVGVKLDFSIVCRDFGSPARMTSSLPIRVFSSASSPSVVNESALTCVRNPYLVTIGENNNAGVTLIRPEALIMQTGSELQYQLSSVNIEDVDISDLVSVNRISGHVLVRKSLDREQIDHFEFNVTAKHGSRRLVTCSVHVTIADVNDNRPTFVFPSAGNDSVLLRMTSSPAYVARVVAKDLDAPGPNSNIVYALLVLQSPSQPEMNKDDTPVFTVDPRSGVVRVTADSRILSTDRKQFVIRVTATDGGSPSLSAEAALKVLITDADDVEETSGQQQRRSTAITFSTSGENGGTLFTLLLIGSLIVILIAVIVIIIVFLVAMADRQRRDAAECDRKSIDQLDVKYQTSGSRQVQTCNSKDPTSILNSSRPGTSFESQQQLVS